MSKLLSLEALGGCSAPDLLEQLSLRRAALDQLVTCTRAAGTPLAIVEALRAHSAALLELGLHDDAARLNAYARAVSADSQRLAAEVLELETRLATLAVSSK